MVVWKWCKRIYINSGHRLLRAWWFIVGGEDYGAKVIIKCGDKILLVKHTYGHKTWTLPGGGIQKSESPEAAARREVFEETDIRVVDLKYIGTFDLEYEHQKNHISCYLVELDILPTIHIDDFEIGDASWCPINAIPKSSSKTISLAITLYEKYSHSYENQGSR